MSTRIKIRAPLANMLLLTRTRMRCERGSARKVAERLDGLLELVMWWIELRSLHLLGDLFRKQKDL
jgi:hypothetical protein